MFVQIMLAKLNYLKLIIYGNNIINYNNNNIFNIIKPRRT